MLKIINKFFSALYRPFLFFEEMSSMPPSCGIDSYIARIRPDEDFNSYYYAEWSPHSLGNNFFRRQM